MKTPSPRSQESPHASRGHGDRVATVSIKHRNLETNVENEETILNELKAARKELKKREDDPILLDKIKALKLRLEKVKQESDFRDEYKDDPYVSQCLVRRLNARGRPRCTDHADESHFSLSFKPSARLAPPRRARRCDASHYNTQAQVRD